MGEKLNLGVYRRLDERFLELSAAEDAKMALDLHNKRKFALEDVLEDKAVLSVADWGETKDENPHEFVEIALGVVGTTVFKYAIVPGLKFVGEKLAEKLVDETIAESVKWLISKLRTKQESKEILNFQLKLPDGTQISVDPPDRNASITIQFKAGTVASIQYDTAKE